MTVPSATWSVFRLGVAGAVRVDQGLTAKEAIARAHLLGSDHVPGMTRPDLDLAEQEVRQLARWRAEGCPDGDGRPTKKSLPSVERGKPTASVDLPRARGGDTAQSSVLLRGPRATKCQATPCPGLGGHNG